MRKLDPQIYPTKKLKGLVDASLAIADRFPIVGELLAKEGTTEESDVEVTLLLPLHRKDLWIADYCASCALENIRHPIKKVIVVSAQDDEIRAWVEKRSFEWCDENDVTRWSGEQIGERLPEFAKNRSRWLLQQLIKLSADEFVRTDAVVVVDADTLLLRPKVFKSDEVTYLDYSHERNLLYLKSFQRLFGISAPSWASFVCHHMFMELETLKHLKKTIEEKSGIPWDETIIDLCSCSVWTEKEKQMRPFNYFSEYETYGNFLLKSGKKVKKKYFRNFAVKGFRPGEVDVQSVIDGLPTILSMGIVSFLQQGLNRGLFQVIKNGKYS